MSMKLGELEGEVGDDYGKACMVKIAMREVETMKSLIVKLTKMNGEL